MSLAVRVDAATGIEERLEHVLTPRGLLYTWTARPRHARTCVLICSSVFGDFMANYHRERQLGRAIASMGHGVIRFHYAGEGNSQGERRDMTFSSLCADAGAVLNHAVSLDFTEFALLGTRIGALVAAATVAPLPKMAVALWEPVTDPLRFLRDAHRARRISGIAQDRQGQSPDWRQELEQNGKLDLFGYDVYAPFVDSLKSVDLLSILDFEPRQVFIGRFRGKEAVKDPMSDELAARGFAVEWGHFDVSESWFLQSEIVAESLGLIASTSAWLDSVLGQTR